MEPEFERLLNLIETTHFVGIGWKSLDQPPEQEGGRAWWDTDESAEDPDDDQAVQECRAHLGESCACPKCRELVEKEEPDLHYEN